MNKPLLLILTLAVVSAFGYWAYVLYIIVGFVFGVLAYFALKYLFRVFKMFSLVLASAFKLPIDSPTEEVDWNLETISKSILGLFKQHPIFSTITILSLFALISRIV